MIHNFHKIAQNFTFCTRTHSKFKHIASTLKIRPVVSGCDPTPQLVWKSAKKSTFSHTEWTKNVVFCSSVYRKRKKSINILPWGVTMTPSLEIRY